VLQADRQEFDRQVSLVCAAYNVPLGERADAFWLAFNKLQLADFIRIVTAVVGPDGPEKMPTVRQLWGIRKTLNTERKAQVDNNAMMRALGQHVFAIARLSVFQQSGRGWSYIAKDNTQEIIGLIVPQDPDDPVKYPGLRVMATELSKGSKAPAFDAAHCLAQRVMLHWLHGAIRIREGRPLPPETLQAVIRVKQDVTETYRLLRSENDPEVDHTWFDRRFRTAADRVAGITREGGLTC